MRRSILDSSAGEEDEGINLTPMLDVVFIMLIFFIVTASFVKEAGIDPERPEAETAARRLETAEKLPTWVLGEDS